MTLRRKPTHPGVFFLEEILQERMINISEAADMLGVSRKSLSQFVNGRARCSQKMARLLSESTGTGVAFWINMQAKLDAWEAENLELDKDVHKMPVVAA